jgi:uncharacterized protein with PhoU and TrkA domain
MPSGTGDLVKRLRGSRSRYDLLTNEAAAELERLEGRVDRLLNEVTEQRLQKEKRIGEVERLETVVDSADRVANLYLRELMGLKAVVDAAREYVSLAGVIGKDGSTLPKLRQALKDLGDQDQSS